MEAFDQYDLHLREPRHGAGPAPAQAQPPHATPRPRHGWSSVWLGARILGALSVLAVGGVHIQQYSTLYSEIPTIGMLFVLNFVGATAIGLGLLSPVERLLGRWGGPALALLTLGGIALAATSFVFLLISERTPLFGFMEPGYDPEAIMFSRVTEVATVVLLGGYSIARFIARTPTGRW